MKREPEFSERPVEGVYIDGLYLEGARWNMENYYVDESFPKVLYDTFPIVSSVGVTVVQSSDEKLKSINNKKNRFANDNLLSALLNDIALFRFLLTVVRN